MEAAVDRSRRHLTEPARSCGWAARSMFLGILLTGTAASRCTVADVHFTLAAIDAASSRGGGDGAKDASIDGEAFGAHHAETALDGHPEEADFGGGGLAGASDVGRGGENASGAAGIADGGAGENNSAGSATTEGIGGSTESGGGSAGIAGNTDRGGSTGTGGNTGSGTGGSTSKGGSIGAGGNGRGGSTSAGGAGGMPSAEGGGTGAGGTSGTGGTSGSSPCKASPCIILPLGDSITHGFGSTDDAGYRSALFKLAVAANQNVTFIGSLSNGPSTISGTTFPKNHEGHDGITVSGITGHVPPHKDFTTTPHIVLLRIGTTDMASNADPTTTASQLDTLLSNIVEAAPDALLVVAKIVPLGYSNTNYDSYIAMSSDIVIAHAARNQNIVMVDMSTLPASDIQGSGNVHPTDKGYSDMADLWYGVIHGYLPN